MNLLFINHLLKLVCRFFISNEKYNKFDYKFIINCKKYNQ